MAVMIPLRGRLPLPQNGENAALFSGELGWETQESVPGRAAIAAWRAAPRQPEAGERSACAGEQGLHAEDAVRSLDRDADRNASAQGD